MAQAVSVPNRFETAVLSSQLKPQAGISVIYSRPGDGKTHLMSEFPDAFFLPLEDGTAGFSPQYHCKFLTVPAPQNAPPGWLAPPLVPRTFAEFGAHMRRFSSVNVPPAPGERKPFSYLMIDGLQPLERLVHAETCRLAGKANMEDGFGLWTASLVVWDSVWAMLEQVRDRGTHVWIAAHSAEEYAANTAGETYRRMTVKMLSPGGRNAIDFPSYITGRADNVWFLSRQVKVTKGTRGRNAVAAHTGRMIYTQPTGEIGGANYFAKSRYKMPPKIAATPEDIRDAMKAGITRPAERILADLAVVLPLLPASQRTEIERDREKLRDNPNGLARLLSRAQGLKAAMDEDEPEGAEEEPATAEPSDMPRVARAATVAPSEQSASVTAPAFVWPAAETVPIDDGPTDVPGASAATAPTADARAQTESGAYEQADKILTGLGDNPLKAQIGAAATAINKLALSPDDRRIVNERLARIRQKASTQPTFGV